MFARLIAIDDPMNRHAPSTPITVVSVDDHALIRSGIRHVLKRHSDISLVGEGASGEEILPLVALHRPDLLLLDIRLPSRPDTSVRLGSRHSTIASVLELRRVYPGTHVVIVSQYDSPPLIRAAVAAGIHGYLLKDDALTDVLAEAIRIVHAGGIYFSEEIQKALMTGQLGSTPALQGRQREVLEAIFADPDLPREQIAQRLNISPHTLTHYLGTIYSALGVTNLAAAFVKALELGLLAPPPAEQSDEGDVASLLQDFSDEE